MDFQLLRVEAHALHRDRARLSVGLLANFRWRRIEAECEGQREAR